MAVMWGQAYEEDGQFYWCTKHIPHFNGSKIAIPVPVKEYDKGNPYIPDLLFTKHHEDNLYKYNDINFHDIRRVTCLHFNSELQEAIEQRENPKTDTNDPQKFFEQLMEDYDLYY
jgi:hypothetical protein